ncbi:MAG: hypothetical protein ABEH66_01535 [Halobacteriales archaeon]
MGLLRSILTIVVVLLLALTLTTGNVVTAVDRTVLNEEFVTTTLEEEEAYRTAQTIVAGEAEKRIEEAESDIPVPVDPERAARETITRAYLKNQTEANVERTFRFLNGETDELILWVDLAPLKDNVADFAAERIRELTVAELIDVVTEGRDLSVTVQNVTFDLRIVGTMSEGPEAYQAAREEFRDDIRTVVLRRAVDEAYRTRSNDELLALIGVNPLQYNETEKERIVAEREDEIKSELETRINETAGDEIDAAVEQQLRGINDEMETVVEGRVNESLAERYQPVAGPTTDLLMVGIDGLTTNMTYETFDERLSEAKANLADGVATVVREELDRTLGDRFVLTENLSADARDQLDRAQQATGTVGLLAILLPILSLVLVGVLYLVTRSVASTTFGSGVALLSAGVGGFVSGTITPGMVERQVEANLSGENVPKEAIDVAIGIVEQVFDALAAQSLWLAALGIALVVAGLYVRRRDDPSGGQPAQ